MDLVTVMILMGYAIVGFILGIFCERLLFNTFAWINLMNMRKGSKKGLGLVFYRNGQHENTIIDFGKKTFDLRDKTFAINSARSGKIFNLPMLVYLEDHALPADLKASVDAGEIKVDELDDRYQAKDMSKESVFVTDSPEEVQDHIKLAILHLMTKEIKDFKRFQNLLLIFAGAGAIFALGACVLLFGQGGGVNAANGKLEYLINMTEMLVNNTVG